MGNRRTLTSIDLFAGAGGLTEGLKEAGFTSLYANEVIEQYAKTFEHNHPGVVVDAQDVREVDAANVRRRLGLERGGSWTSWQAARHAKDSPSTPLSAAQRIPVTTCS